MNRRASRQVIAWLLMAAMVLSLDMTAVFAANDVTDLLQNVTVSATQDGVDLGSETVLDFDKPISIRLQFKVPVIGDGIEGDVVTLGDIASIELAKGFKVTSGVGPFTLDQDGVKIGTLTLVTTGSGIDASVRAEIVFDGEDDVFNGEWQNIFCTLDATLGYDGPGAGTEDKTYTVEILKKKYTVAVPQLPVELSGEKTGERDGQFIDWKVKVEAKQGADLADMGGYLFSDDLTNVGEYVDGSFAVGTSDDRAEASSAAPDYTDNKLTYSFPDETVGTRYLFFRTEIPEGKLYTNNTEKVTNTAKVHDGEVEKLSELGEVSFKFEWINKVGATANLDYENNVGNIIWTITANQGGATLENAVITDVLNEHLQWQGATLKTWNGSAWVTNPDITFSTKPEDGKYSLGKITTPVQLTIRTSIKSDSFNIGHTEQMIDNNASISWTGKDGIGSGNVNVGIGLNPISKTVGPGGYNASTHTIPWQVSVEKSDVNVDLHVLDLLVYGSGGFSWDTIASLEAQECTPAGLANLDLATVKTRNPIARYNQKYANNSFTSDDGLSRVVYTLKNNADVAVADLLVVTGSGGSGINVGTKTQEFGFSTVVTNPDVYAKNGTTTIHNTAVLYSANNKLNDRTASVQCTSHMLAKDMLDRTHAANPDTNKNGAGANTGAAYNYQDHTVVFRLHVNANNLTNFTNDLTTVDGQPIGNVTLTDTLPDGWEFVDIVDGKKFLIYEGEGSPSEGKVTAGDEVADTSFLTADFGASGRAVFTFTELTKPYVILVKAKATPAKVEEYFKSNGTYSPVNSATLSAVNWTPGVTDTQKVTIRSQILGKSYSVPEQGVLNWEVEYKPNEIGHIGAVIKDTLPVGLDLRTDAFGKLILDGNISAIELTLNADGTYSNDSAVTLIQGDNVSYNNTTRVLQFNIPDPEKAYRLTYKTDITANPGASLTNRVELISGSANQDGVDSSYLVAAADVSATMERSGWLEIMKQDGVSSAPLSGVEFTLFAADGITVIRTGATGADGKLTLRGLPIGNYVLKETASLEGYNPLIKTYDVIVKTEGSKLVTSIEGQTGASSNKITVRNYKTATVGDLTIRKTTTGAVADPLKEFDFTVTIAGVTGDYEYVGGGGKADGVITFTAGLATFKLRGSESITIKHLPKDAAYAVSEANYRSTGYATTSTGETGAIMADEVVTASFTNTRVGWIEITKLDAANGKPLAGAEFTLFEEDGVTVATGITVGTTDADGKLWLLNLAEGTYILQETKAPTGYNLPEKVTYRVLVEKVEDDIVATIEGSIDNKITVVNYETDTVGDLVISKTIAGGAADPRKEFNFTVTIAGVTGSYEYVGGGGKPSGTIDFDAEGSSTLTLKGGESIRIKYLPKNVAYTVVEDDYRGERYSTTKAGDAGLVVADDVVMAAFVNTKHSLPVPPQTGGLMITKTVTGEGADKTKQFAFTVTFSSVGEAYAYTGVGVPNGTLRSGDTVLLSHGQSITITGVPAGTSYAVEETDYTIEGYIANAEYSSGTITADSIAVARFINTKTEEQPVEPVDPDEPGDPEGPGEPVEPGDPGDPDESIGDGNTPGGPGKPGGKDPSPGGELPKAGGFLDTSVLILGGVLLILVGMGYALMKRKARNNVV